jgi:hypothetical protein
MPSSPIICRQLLSAAVAGVLFVAVISIAKTKNSRHGSEMGVFSQQLENLGI